MLSYLLSFCDVNVCNYRLGTLMTRLKSGRELEFDVEH